MSALHPRAVIRRAVAALLKDKTAAGRHVFRSRVGALMSRELPAISVYTTDEGVDDNETSPRRYTRTPDVVVQIVVEADLDADDMIDALALEVENILLPDPTWGGVAKDSLLTKTASYLASDGRHECACHEFVFQAEYDTRPGLLNEATLDDFATANVTYDLAPPDGIADAEDKIQLPTQTTE